MTHDIHTFGHPSQEPSVDIKSAVEYVVHGDFLGPDRIGMRFGRLRGRIGGLSTEEGYARRQEDESTQRIQEEP